MKAKLIVITQGVKGKNKHFSEQGMATLTTGDVGIYIDAFSGSGSEYKRREE